LARVAISSVLAPGKVALAKLRKPRLEPTLAD
jgi:hypothetical protein